MDDNVSVGNVVAIKGNSLKLAATLNGDETIIIIQGGRFFRTTVSAFSALFGGLTEQEINEIIDNKFSNLPKPTELLKQIGTQTPILIENYQNTYAAKYGNSPIIQVDQLLANGVRRTRNDLQIEKIYASGKLTSFSLNPPMVDDNNLTMENLIIIIQ